MCYVNIGSVVAQAGMDVPLTVLRELSIGLADLDVGLRAQRHLAPPPAVVGGGGYRLGSGGTPGADTLQHLHRDEIYAVGDSARFVPLPRIGMHGVRQGPILHACLLTRLRNQPLPVYESQRRALSILDLGDGVGLAVRGRRWWYGAGPWRLKRFIDRRWLRIHREGGARSRREWRYRYVRAADDC